MCVCVCVCVCVSTFSNISSETTGPIEAEGGKTMDFSEIIVVSDLKLATDDLSDDKFLLPSKLCPLGAVKPLPLGCIHI